MAAAVAAAAAWRQQRRAPGEGCLICRPCKTVTLLLYRYQQPAYLLWRRNTACSHASKATHLSLYRLAHCRACCSFSLLHAASNLLALHRLTRAASFTCSAVRAGSGEKHRRRLLAQDINSRLARTAASASFSRRAASAERGRAAAPAASNMANLPKDIYASK